MAGSDNTIRNKTFFTAHQTLFRTIYDTINLINVILLGPKILFLDIMICKSIFRLSNKENIIAINSNKTSTLHTSPPPLSISHTCAGARNIPEFGACADEAEGN